jgi:M6 family metalloprotease-like protein
VPSTGTATLPVILINFSDTLTTFSPAQFNDLLFGVGNKSMRDYYLEVSYGKFMISAGPGGIAGWYTAPKTHDYYGDDSSGRDANVEELIVEAVKAADTAGFNFAPYDQNGDCYVDVVSIVHQGQGQENSETLGDIWSHFSSILPYTYTTNDPCPAGGFISVSEYIIQPEGRPGWMTTIGVFAHEYGHALGLPDLYDYDYTSHGIGAWSLMASGVGNYTTRSGDTPAHLDAWSKYALGWVAPRQVTGPLVAESIEQAETVADVYQLLSGSPSTGGEYFLVENRQKTGFDAALPGAGLLIWHIDESQSPNANECNPLTTSCATIPYHYKIALVQADNLWDLESNVDDGDDGDPYPGSFNNIDFTNLSLPSSNLYSGSPSSVGVSAISASAPTMTATFNPFIYDICVQKYTRAKARVKWDTLSSAIGQVGYGTVLLTYPNYRSLTSITSTYATSQTFYIELSPTAIYHLGIFAWDEKGNKYISEDHTFTLSERTAAIIGYSGLGGSNCVD